MVIVLDFNINHALFEKFYYLAISYQRNNGSSFVIKLLFFLIFIFYKLQLTQFFLFHKMHE
jgi:hypothetical protein